MKRIKKLLFVIIIFGISLIGLTNLSKAATGDTGTYGDLEYKEYDDTITIKRLLNRTTVTEVTIPKEINGKEVDTISGQFATPSAGEVVALKRITIPSTVQNVGSDYYGAFENAVNLEEIIVDSSSQYLCSIDGVLYNKDKTKLIAYPANKKDANYTIQNTVTKIQTLAFAFAKNIDIINIPETVTEIGKSCFTQSSIKSITIPKSVEEIESYLCYKCPNLTTVEVNGYIGYNAFQGCPNLTTVKLGDKCNSISSSAFQDCSNLKDVNFETCKVVSIEKGAFINCTSLPRKIKMTSSILKLTKKAFDSDVQIEFIGDDYIEATDEWNKCVNIKVNATQNYTEAYKVFELTNEERKKESLTELKLDKNLMDIAMQRAYEISVYYAHRRPEVYRGFSIDGADYDTQIFMEDTTYRMGLYNQITFSGENIAYNYSSAEKAVKGWMASTGHKANILGQDHTTMGVGVIKIGNDYCWVQIFGNNTYTKEETRNDKTETRIIPVTTSYISEIEGYEGITLVCSKTLDVGSTTKVKVKSNLAYANAATYIEPSGFSWSSSNEKVVTVDQNGNVKGILPGSAEIIMTMSNGKTRKCSITVNNSLLKGDVNKDKKINLYDALQILKQAILGGTLTDEQLYIMDYNDDGKVNLYDALKFLQQAILQ